MSVASETTEINGFRVGYLTDIGRRRSQNQDNLAVHPELGLFLVADGMGGHRGGETASQMVSEIIPQEVREALSPLVGENTNWDPKVVVSDAIRAANNAIFERSKSTPLLQGMGTTTTALLFKNGRLVIGHVGDSRCYFFRPHASESGQVEYSMWQATRDHSLVQEKLRAGLITRAEIKTDKMKNVITRSVGFELNVQVETYELHPQPGDLFLICSDGLSGLVEDNGIRGILRQKMPQLKDTVQELVDTANRNGGDDNVTSVLIEYVGES